ncbi:hypothetical protein [Aliivibrio fischeri]|uniref:hypothetical protein n=1 Tax=Aliivibrio fischeri TaxID=668 RepID=UPI001F39E7AA|nr:hypothetical protein [Aliivibrio fischeri]
MKPQRGKKGLFIEYSMTAKHEKYGFTSLETLSTWNSKISKNKETHFTCKKESTLIIPK